MTVLPRNLLIGSFLMVAALVAASCSSSDTGQTLSVTAVPNSPQQVQTGQDVTANPLINYKGKKTLQFNWSLIQPAGGQASIVSGGSSKTPVFNFVKPGDYKVVLNVQEVGGSISQTDTGIYSVVAGVLTAGGPDVTVSFTNVNPAVPLSQSGTVAVTISGGVAPYRVNWLTGSPATSNSVTLNFSPSFTDTSTNGATKGFSLQTPGVSSAPAAFTISGSVTDSSGQTAVFSISILVIITAAS